MFSNLFKSRSITDAKGVSLPWFDDEDDHLMMPFIDLRRGVCCGRFDSIIEGFYCKICDIFVHKRCSESSKFIQHPSHSAHPLELKFGKLRWCNLCGSDIVISCYRCEMCDFHVDLYCAKYPPPEIIDDAETHAHKLTLLRERTSFSCFDKCGKVVKGFRYKCHECDLDFCVDCVWSLPEVKHPSEVYHSHHSMHPLKLLKGQPPDYSDGKCRLCGRETDGMFYHCSSCNFTLDMRCVLSPPPQSLLDLKAHDHNLTLLPRLRSFTCNACGLSGDRSPYLCIQCDFMIHQDCLDLPRLININRHDHRVSRTSVLGVVNSVCGVCRQKVDWTCGGYFCKRCPGYVIHSKCATRKDVWNEKELDGVPEEIEDIEPYVVIDDKTIHHFLHKKHYLRLHLNGILYEGNKRCSACIHPIGLQSFYECMECDFVLHQNCANCPRKKRHVLHNERLTLVSSGDFRCGACDRLSNGFMYTHEHRKLDVICGSISEPFIHPSHPHHPLYYIPSGKREICNGCNYKQRFVLRCIEDGCGYRLGFECATLPQMVKHRVDDYPLSLCYGEKASGKYWCDICEKETNPENWFYTCKDHQASLHTECLLGDFSGLMPRSTIEFGDTYEVVLNNSVSRPFCWRCESHCISPVILKCLGTSDKYVCSWSCLRGNRFTTLLGRTS